MNVLLVCMYVHHTCLVPKKVRRGLQTPLGTAITDICKPPCGCWQLNLGPSGRETCALNH